MKNHHWFPAMRDGKMSIYIEYNDGTDDIIFYDNWDLALSKRIEETAKKHIIDVRLKKLKKLNETKNR
jgi:hypothetical protein